MSTVPSLQHHPFTCVLSAFEGPLDLLLHLVQQERLDVTAISLVQVTDQYLVFMRAEDRIDHRALADFVAIGARLIWLKSRALLPLPANRSDDGDDGEEPGDDLVEMLQQYQRFKDASSLLREREEQGLRSFPRLAPPPQVPVPPGLSHVTLDRLVAIVGRALARAVAEREPEPLSRPRHTVQEKIEALEVLLQLAGEVSFSTIMAGCQAREEVLTAFFAVLELIKRCRLVAVQTAPFDDIVLARAPVARCAGVGEEEKLVSETDLAGV